MARFHLERFSNPVNGSREEENGVRNHFAPTLACPELARREPSLDFARDREPVERLGRAIEGARPLDSLPRSA